MSLADFYAVFCAEFPDLQHTVVDNEIILFSDPKFALVIQDGRCKIEIAVDTESRYLRMDYCIDLERLPGVLEYTLRDYTRIQEILKFIRQLLTPEQLKKFSSQFLFDGLRNIYRIWVNYGRVRLSFHIEYEYVVFNGDLLIERYYYGKIRDRLPEIISKYFGIPLPIDEEHLLTKEYLWYPDNDNLCSLVCRIVNQGTEVMAKRSAKR